MPPGINRLRPSRQIESYSVRWMGPFKFKAGPGKRRTSSPRPCGSAQFERWGPSWWRRLIPDSVLQVWAWVGLSWGQSTAVGEGKGQHFGVPLKTFDCLQSLQIWLSQPLKPINIELKLNKVFLCFKGMK